jgi:hypothetical protein
MNAARPPTDEAVFQSEARFIVGSKMVMHGGNHILDRDFRAHFGVNAHVCQKIWELCEDNFFAKNILPKHLLWGLLFLKTYSTEPILATMTGISRKSFRLWAWQVISIVASKKRDVVSTILMCLHRRICRTTQHPCSVLYY